jgi:hypothetical protein
MEDLEIETYEDYLPLHVSEMLDDFEDLDDDFEDDE